MLGSWRQVMQSYLTQVLTSCQRTDSNLDGFGLMPLFKSISSLASIELKHPITFYHRVAPFCSWSMSLSFFLMTTEAPQSTAKLPLKNTKWGQLTFFINYTYFPKFCRASSQVERLPLSKVSIQIRYKMIRKLLFLHVIHPDHSKHFLIWALGHLPSGCLFKILALSVVILFLIACNYSK